MTFASDPTPAHDWPEGHFHELHTRASECEEIETTVALMSLSAQLEGIDPHPIRVFGHDDCDDVIPPGGAWFLGCWMKAEGKTFESHAEKLRAPKDPYPNASN